jgi:TonB-linked SusC/RagA family outer membrane protein
MEYKNSKNKFLGKDKKKYVILCLILFSWVFRPDMLYAQQSTVTLSVTNVNLQSVFDRIEKETNYRFTYKDVVLPIERTVSISVNDKPIEAFLNQLLASTNLSFKRNGNSFAIIQKPVRKDITVSGSVVDETGESLPGVNISIKGTTTGVISDVNGKYSIAIPDGNVVLAFSFIGFGIQEIAVGNRAVIDVTLNEDTRQLDEVVVIGYGAVRKSDLTGSVTRVNTNELSNLPVSSIGNALQGRAAGVQITSTGGAPGAGTSIRIRGGNSISADNEPLYVIDGFIGGGDLRSINPADIASVEILKDATATSIYGSRGANGVILVTTKKGKEGTNKIGLNFFQGFQALPKKLPYMNGTDRAMFANDYAIYTGAPIPFPDMGKVQNTDWQDQITQVAPVTNADISISGGSANLQHFISANYYNQEGIYKSSGFTRYQTRINLDKRLYNWLKVGIIANANSLHTDNPKVDFYDGIKLALTCIPVYDDDGAYVYKNPIDGQLFNNPVAMNNLLKTDTYSKRFLGNFYTEISPLNGLIIRTTVGGDYLGEKTERYEPGMLPNRASNQKGGLARLDYRNYFSLLNENTINYTFDLHDSHRFSILGGFTVQKEKASTSYTKVEGLSNDIMEINKLSAGDPSTVTYDSNATESQMLSYLGRINYTFLNKYLLTLVSRYDGSSRLAANHKWAFFPSAALAWRLGEESFIKNINLFHNLKLRASYGLIGNQAISTYQSLASLTVVNPTLGGNKQTGYLLGNIANPDLKWETTSQLDFGVEAAFLQGRLSVEFDYYRKITQDLLMNVEIPWTSGYRTQLQNIGKIRNQGIEFMLNASIIDNKAFGWDLNMNISRNRNKVLDIAEADYIDVQKGVRLYKDMPAGVFVGAIYEGTWKSQAEIDANPGYMTGARPGTAKFKDVNNNGIYDGVGDYEILGNSEADFFGGFGSHFRYKDFDLDLFFQGSYGNDILSPAANYLFFGDFSSNLFQFDEAPWSEKNTGSNVPAAGAFPYNINVNNLNYSPSIQDGSYLKLKTLKLGYRLPARNISWLSQCNIYIVSLRKVPVF